MSRSGYTDDADNWDLIRWRGQVASSIRGRRGQKLLRELAEAMDVMPEKRLIANDLKRDGEFCALGVVGAARGIDLDALDPEEPEDVAAALDIACPLAKEIAFMNDDWGELDTPEQRWERMRRWVDNNLTAENKSLNE